MGFDFVAIDFETANANYSSACSMGIVVVSNNIIIDKYYTLIQPPTLEFEDVNIGIHGITPSDVANAPKFDEVWTRIKHYFDGTYLLTAYNAAFDMTVLKACLKEYNIDYPDFEYVCALQICTRLYDKCEKHTLDCMCKHLNICLEEHHNALFDTIACAEIIIKTIDILKDNSYELLFKFLSNLSWKQFFNVKEVKYFAKSKPKQSSSKFAQHVAITSLVPNTDAFDVSHPCYKRSFVFTGELSSISRSEAMQKVVDIGGIVRSTVGKSTNFIVVGVQDKSIVGSDGLSSKERKALELIEDGYSIKILNEDEFLKLLA